jgi:4-hydroxy-2-oxoheptanedioate aldolase
MFSNSTFLPPNAFKAALAAGLPQIGIWSSLCSNIAAEILAGSGFDWILIDTEHAPNEVPGVLSQLQAMAAGTSEPVVRCAWNDTVMMKRILDIGARSILVPFVQNAQEAQAAVSATRYPPLGNRGVSVAQRANRYGRVADYHRKAHEDICVLVQVETRAAVSQIEAIAAVDGVDGIFIGPSDLAADLGHLADPRHPEVQALIADACARIRAAGKSAGMLSGDPEDSARYFDMGFTFVAVGSDLGILAWGAAKRAADLRNHLAGRAAAQKHEVFGTAPRTSQPAPPVDGNAPA